MEENTNLNVDFKANESKPRKFYVMSGKINSVVTAMTPEKAAVICFANYMREQLSQAQAGEGDGENRNMKVAFYALKVRVSESGTISPVAAKLDGAEFNKYFDNDYVEYWKKAHASDVSFPVTKIINAAFEILQREFPDTSFGTGGSL